MAPYRRTESRNKAAPLLVGAVVNGPNPLAVARSILRVLATVRQPRPTGPDGRMVDHRRLASILKELERTGAGALADLSGELEGYLGELETIDPDALSRPEALAYWINAYNAGTLQLVARADAGAQASVLRVPGAFDYPYLKVAGERLSLDAVEHAKIRRFGDPRIHGSLVCGSVSCPTLRATPYTSDSLDDQLDDQMRRFLADGGAAVTPSLLMLSRVFLWYGADFVRPSRMPAFLPAARQSLGRALLPWLPDQAVEALRAGVSIGFQPYDWGLGCTVN